MKYFRILFLFTLLLFLFGCPDKDTEMDSDITIINRSNQSLIMWTDFEAYPDTTIHVGSNPFDEVIRDRFTIKPNSTYKQKANWRSSFNRNSSRKYLMIFLFDTSVLDTVAWSKIREDYLIAKRYELTLQQLDSLNWTITYP